MIHQAVLLPVLVLLASLGCTAGGDGRIRGYEGTMVALHDGRLLKRNPERASIRYLPASTFKMPNTLIALETGVAEGPEHLITWDGVIPEDQFWAESWSRDHTLRSAFRNGVYWYYSEVARRIGRERMSAWVGRFDYGNKDLTGPVDTFWLRGGLRISAEEQVRFLDRFLRSNLGLSPGTVSTAREIFVLQKTDAYSLSGKTGSVYLPSGRLLAWFAGYVEVQGNEIPFAMNLECPDYESCSNRMRREAVLEMLTGWGIVPGTANP